jgi:hypothetical protein
MTDHKLMPKHGEIVDINAQKALAIVTAALKLQTTASLDLSVVLSHAMIHNEKQVVKLPCRQCVLDIALQFYDLSELLKELVDGK